MTETPAARRDSQDAADGEGYGVGILHNGAFTVQDEIFRVGRGKGSGKSVKDQSGKHQYKKHWEQ